MTVALLAALLLTIATAAGIWRAYRKSLRWTSPSIWLQPLVAVVLYALLFPPSIAVPADTLTVFTAGTKNASAPWLRPAIALPGAGVSAAVERAPDLATALRQHPQTRTLVVIGDGLPLRDQAAVGDLGVVFKAAAEHGLLELKLPPPVPLGTQWRVSGRLAVPIAHIELHDPSGAMVDSVLPDAEGRFAVTGVARAEGTSRFELRLLDAKQAVIETASVPIVARGGESMSVILRVGAPDPEFKYWRRWASDAGITLRLRAGLSENVDLRDGDTTLTPTALMQTDLVILDERAWTTLDVMEKSALSNAVENGLGLLLRVDGSVDPAVAADWATLGVTVEPGDAHSVTLDNRTGLRDRTSFNVAPAVVALEGGTPLLLADDGEVLGRWRSAGRGRIGTWSLMDSYRLTLLGEPARYAALWAQVLGTLSRPQTMPKTLQIPATSWVDEQLVLCDLGQSASIIPPVGDAEPLTVDRNGCAALWPDQAGVYTLQSGGASTAFFVRAETDAGSLRDARDRQQTRQLQRSAAVMAGPLPTDPRPIPRMPLLVLWLLLAALLWWRERPTE